ncbi:Histidine ammonia-lyase [Streptomyces fumanus]
MQDAYSVRCAPQVAGAGRDTLAHARLVAERELAAAVDNPVVLPDGRVESNGNFHGAPVAYVLDFLAVAVAHLGSIAERRTDRLLDKNRSHGLPPVLADDASARTGLIIAQYTQAALVSELKRLAVPASADSIPPSAMQEDHVSMLGPARRRASCAPRSTTSPGSSPSSCTPPPAPWSCARRASPRRPPRRAVVEALRKAGVQGPGPDRFLAPDLAAAEAFVRDGGWSRRRRRNCNRPLRTPTAGSRRTSRRAKSSKNRQKPSRSRRTEYATKPAPRERKTVPPTTYGVLSKPACSASRVPPPAAAGSAAAGLACSVTWETGPRRGCLSPGSRRSRWRTGRTTGHTAGSPLRRRSATDGERMTRDSIPLWRWRIGRVVMLVKGAGHGQWMERTAVRSRRRTPETLHFVRVRVDLVLEVNEEEVPPGAGPDRRRGRPPDAERAHAEGAVTADTAEALAHLVDPFDLVSEVPGVELARRRGAPNASTWTPTPTGRRG